MSQLLDGLILDSFLITELYVLEQDDIHHLSEQQPDRKLDRRLLKRVILSNLALELLLTPLRDGWSARGIKPALTSDETDDVAFGRLLAKDVAESEVVG